MYPYLELLNKPEIFLLTATLLVIVLLTWIQMLSRGGDQWSDYNINRDIGQAWTYLAISSILIASLIFPAEHTSEYVNNKPHVASGFLFLAFFMTAFTIILTGFLYTFFKIIIDKPIRFALPKVENTRDKIFWIITWIIGFLGLVITSFTLCGAFDNCLFWIGVGIIVLWFVLMFIGITLNRNIYKRKGKSSGNKGVERKNEWCYD